MENVGCRGDRITAEEERTSALLRSHNQAPCGCGVAVHVGVNTWADVVALDAVGRNRSVDVVSVVITGLHHLGISLENRRFLGKLVFELAQSAFERTVEEPADKAEGKHIFATENRFEVEP